MYGLIVKLTSTPGRRAELIEVLSGDNSHPIAGCLSFIVAEDTSDEDVLWVTEVWASEASHKASLELSPSKPGLPTIETLIADYERLAVTKPVEKHSPTNAWRNSGQWPNPFPISPDKRRSRQPTYGECLPDRPPHFTKPYLI